MSKVLTLAFHRGRLPHWLVADHSYFVTLCRKGCLPARVVAELRDERKDLARMTALSDRAFGTSARTSGSHHKHYDMHVGRDVTDRPALDRPASARPATNLLAARQRFARIDAVLDATKRSERDLCESTIASVILGNLDWLRRNGWRIWAATLMPSHAHLVLRNVDGRNDRLRQDLSRFMAYTARMINAKKNTKGSPFWQRECFDHWCRDSDSWRRSVNYTANNPVKAGLTAAWRDWEFTVIDPEVASLLA